MKTKIMILSLLGIVALASCGTKKDHSQDGEDPIKILTPTGAPTAAFYDFPNNENYIYETNSTPSNVGAQLQHNQYDAVVFDFYNGLKSIKNNNTQYRLARVITGGNLYLVGINHTEEPTSDDPGYIVSFGQNLLPDLVYKNIYGEEIASVTNYVAGVSDCAGILQSGLHNGNQVDYVLVAQPVLFASLQAVSNNPDATHTLTVVASLRDKWEEKTGQKAIPQAGLFIDINKYNANKSAFDAFLAEVDDSVDTCIEDPTTMKNGLDDYGDADAQKAFFGFTSQIAYNVQKDGANGFAFVSSEDADTIDINAFLTSLGKGSEDYSNYII